MVWSYNDGGRAEAGFKGATRDCVCRAIAIASEKPYKEIYDMINEYAKRERPGAKRRKGKRSSAREGVFTPTMRRVLADLGWEWVPTMQVGTGCTTHLKADELPSGRIICRVSRHLTTMIDGVVHDTHDPTRWGTRCVYGYWRKP